MTILLFLYVLRYMKKGIADFLSEFWGYLKIWITVCLKRKKDVVSIKRYIRLKDNPEEKTGLE